MEFPVPPSQAVAMRDCPTSGPAAATEAAGDERLIGAAVAGSADAFDSLLGPFVASALRVALLMLDDSAAAEDAVQEAVLRAWRRLPQIRDGRAVGPWFMAIVANECRSVRRRRWWSTLRLPERPEGPAPAIDEPSIRAVDLARAFQRLTPQERMLVHLYFYEDMPLDHVAVAAGLSLSAARSRLYRALRRLRAGLEVREVVR
jgi:RNA polymerase sigma-70 factor (ECF subfamily)